ncbi:hypothetical protein ACQ4PT_001775 [Festuca glaucescens]
MTVNRFLSLGYCAPEYLYGGRMSVKSDIYSLGVIIIELVTGHKSIPDQNNVLRRWRHRWKKSAKETPLGYQQVTKCIEIGLRCQENDPYRRPFIGDILHDIIEIEDISGQNSNTSGSTTAEISPYMEDDMLGIEPLQLHFPFELNKQISCSLQLTNMTDSYIAFSVQTASPLQYYTHPNKDIVPPRSKFTIDITLQPQKNAPRHADGFIVRSTKVNDGLVAEDITTEIFNREAGNVVDEVNLDVIFNAQLQAPHLSEEPNNFSLGLLAVLGTEDLKNREASNVSALFAHTGSEETVSKVTFVEKTHAALCSLDANQTEPWIITGHYDGCVCLWHYDMQASY